MSVSDFVSPNNFGFPLNIWAQSLNSLYVPWSKCQPSLFMPVCLEPHRGGHCGGLSTGRNAQMKEGRGTSCQCLAGRWSRAARFLFLFLVCPQRVHLDIQVGEHANDYAEIAAKDKLSELQLRVRQLVEQVEQIQKEQNYQRVCGWARSSWVGFFPEAFPWLSQEWHVCQIHYESQGT